MPEDLAWFTSRLRERVDATDEQATALFEHYQLLRRWNQRMNLTSIDDPDEIVVRHYAESLFVAANLPDAPPGTTIADIGSGPGFPGFPMAVYRPDWQVTLIESHQRKAVFLREAARAVPNLQVIAARAEQVAQRFDWLVSRAVAPEYVLALTPQLAPRAGLLIATSDFERLQHNSRVIWSKPIPLPSGTCVLACAYAAWLQGG